jgi:hypothetical protein
MLSRNRKTLAYKPQLTATENRAQRKLDLANPNRGFRDRRQRAALINRLNLDLENQWLASQQALADANDQRRRAQFEVSLCEVRRTTHV